ncbi:hypothetical protein EK904_000817 [Melospiza melodia maxima]|nr:hypothetical protein EK904_000817 [Melospiza melodia maxima]
MMSPTSTFHNSGSQRKQKQRLYAFTEVFITSQFKTFCFFYGRRETETFSIALKVELKPNCRSLSQPSELLPKRDRESNIRLRKIDIKRNILQKNHLTQAPPQTSVNLPGNETQRGNRMLDGNLLLALQEKEKKRKEKKRKEKKRKEKKRKEKKRKEKKRKEKKRKEKKRKEKKRKEERKKQSTSRKRMYNEDNCDKGQPYASEAYNIAHHCFHCAQKKNNKDKPKVFYIYTAYIYAELGQLHPGFLLTPFKPSPPHCSFQPRRVPPDDQGLGYGGRPTAQTEPLGAIECFLGQLVNYSRYWFEIYSQP